MTSDRKQAPLDEVAVRFEQRARQLLLDSVDVIAGADAFATDAARYAAFVVAAFVVQRLMRHWMPAGAVRWRWQCWRWCSWSGRVARIRQPTCSRTPRPRTSRCSRTVMQCSSDATEDVDYDFYEWAVDEAKGANAPSMGT